MTDRLLDRRRALVGPSLRVSYHNPLTIVRGEMQYLYDEHGRQYLDCVNNVCHVGHCHPRVVAAACEQIGRLNTNTRYLHETILDYTERLTATLPDPLAVAYLVCSGSEANELALRLARAATANRRDVIVVDAAYHGNTSSLIDISPYKHNGPGGLGPPPHVHTVPLPDVYRGVHRDPASAGAAYARFVEDACEHPSAFIAESLPGCGGQIVLPGGYLAHAFRAVRAAGGVCIADEVQCGFGRVGRCFWGFELQEVVPDILTLGKPIGNGHPMAAVVTTREIADAFDNGMEYFNTFGGNPVSSAIGLAVLDVIASEELQSHALATGEHLMAGLRELQTRYPALGDVRGQGLFIGVECVSDPDARTPDESLATRLVERMRERNVLLSTDGPDHNVIKIKPPLPFSRADADRVVTELEASLRDPPR